MGTLLWSMSGDLLPHYRAGKEPALGKQTPPGIPGASHSPLLGAVLNYGRGVGGGVGVGGGGVTTRKNALAAEPSLPTTSTE